MFEINGGGRTFEKKLLIVDDNPLTLQRLAGILEGRGYSVTTCLGSAEAKNLLYQTSPDLIILDIILPEEDGYQLCRWIRQEPRLRYIPIIFVTAKTDLNDKITGLKSGGDDYITKPFEPEEIIARIEVILQRMQVFHDLSMRDELTGAYNRRYFNEKLEDELNRCGRNSRPFSIAVIDIDFFKNINDTYGHQVGDYILVQLVRVLQARLRKSDFVARLGGEEFVLLLPETPGENAFSMMERLRLQLMETIFPYQDPISGDYIDIRITVSAGISTFPDDAGSGPALLELADKALYAAKSKGRNTVVRCGL
jgi:diguanylate cyclase (GGDEF)-like protein